MIGLQNCLSSQGAGPGKPEPSLARSTLHPSLRLLIPFSTKKNIRTGLMVCPSSSWGGTWLPAALADSTLFRSTASRALDSWVYLSYKSRGPAGANSRCSNEFPRAWTGRSIMGSLAAQLSPGTWGNSTSVWSSFRHIQCLPIPEECRPRSPSTGL